MKYVIKRIFLFGIVFLPFIPIMVVYFINDPFMVLRNYNDYSHPVCIPNRDYVSVQNFINRYRENNYNSFIFGSSRTIGVNVSEWQKHLRRDARIFKMDASAESIYGIYKKVIFLDSMQVDLKNALLFLDRDVTFNNVSNNSREMLYIKHPAISGESEWDFQLVFFKAYMNPKFLIHYFDYLINKKYKPEMKGYIDNRVVLYDKFTNEMTIVGWEKFASDTSAYYTINKDYFYSRSGEKVSEKKQILDPQYFMLKEIKRIFDKHGTDFKIVLNPLYEQQKFHAADREMMKQLFGENLYDFTGKNEYTENKYNYFEAYHYKSSLGSLILRKIYQK